MARAIARAFDSVPSMPHHAPPTRSFRPRLPFLLLLITLAVGCARPDGARSSAAAQDPTSSTAATSTSPVTAPASTSWPRVPVPADVPRDRPLRAGFLIVDGVYNTELTAPFDILEHVRYHHQPGIEAFTVSADGSTITTAEGIVIQPAYGFADAPPIDILVVASAEHSRDDDRANESLIAWVRETGQSAHYVMSLCWGAFVLAEAGLLDEAACTTFPRDFDRFAETFPQLDVRRGPTFVHDGKMITSQGGIRSFEAAMYLVDHLYGPEVARGVGGGLLIDWPYPAHVPSPDVIP